MKRSWILTIVVALFLSIGGLYYLVLTSPKDKSSATVVFVRSQELIYKYKGTMEAMEKFQQESKHMQSNLDTLKSDYERSLRVYQQGVEGFSVEERKEQEALLEHQYTNLFNLSDKLDKQLGEREDEIMQTVLNQINSFSERYARDNGYDLILGTTSSGNVLFGAEYLDITDELLDALNKDYQGV